MEFAGALAPNKMICCLKAAAIALHNSGGYATSAGVANWPLGSTPHGRCSWLLSHRIPTDCNCGIACTNKVCFRLCKPNMQW